MKQHYLHGHPVHIVKPEPEAKEQLSDHVIVSNKFRHEINQWLEQFFGIEYINTVPDGYVFMRDNYLHMNEKTLNESIEKHRSHYVFR